MLRAMLDLSVVGNGKSVFINLVLSLLQLHESLHSVPLRRLSYAKQYLYVSTTLTFGILYVINTGSIFGRSLLGLVGNNFGSVNNLAFVMFLRYNPRLLVGIFIFSVSYGLFASNVSICRAVWPDIGESGTGFGLYYSLAGFGILVGNPAARYPHVTHYYQAPQICRGTYND